jgi:type II secretory pathway component PulF
MSSFGKQQETILEATEAHKKTAEQLTRLYDALENQHKDSEKYQKYMLCATILMVIATVVMIFK